MRVFKIRKRSGGTRTIYAPSDDEKGFLRSWLPAIAADAIKRDKHGVQHGFTPNRSPVTNALAHVGYAYTLCFDLADFFDSVKPEMFHGVYGGALMTVRLVPSVRDAAFPDGAARQGLPTSPAIANCAAAGMDADLIAKRGRMGTPWVYTRYADDLTFSFNALHCAAYLLDYVPKVAKRHGFEVNHTKTRLQWSGAGRRVVTGVAITTDGNLIATREIKRKLRAARHQGKSAHVAGLREWMLLKLPKKYVVPGKAPAATGQPANRRSAGGRIGTTFAWVRRKLSL